MNTANPSRRAGITLPSTAHGGADTALRRGFTLIELVVALSIVAMIGSVSVLVLRTTIDARGRVDHQSNLQQEARAAVTAIATALANAERVSKTDDIVLEGTPQRSGPMPEDRIRFASISHQIIRSGQPESDVHEVEFAIAAPDANHPPVLLRRTNPVRDDPPRRGGVIEHVANDVVGLRFQYFDGTRWQEEWPATRLEWPVAIRIWLGVADPDTPRALIEAARLVNFPRRPQPSNNQPNSNAAQQQNQQGDQNGGQGGAMGIPGGNPGGNPGGQP